MPEFRPLVSAIVPTTGRPKMLKRAIRSVDSQSYSNIEIIIVETPSGKGALGGTQAKNITNRPVEYILTDSDVGPSEARNNGIRRSSGEYISFLDDDDEWLENKIEKQVAELVNSGSQTCASIVGNEKVDSSGKVISTYEPADPDNPVLYQLCWNIGSFSMLMIDSCISEEVGYIDEEFDRREDQDFLLRIVLDYNLKVHPEPLVRKHSGEYPQLGNDYEAGVRANSRFREKHGDLAAELDACEAMETAFEFSLGRTALNNQNYSQARRHFMNVVFAKPLDKGHLVHFLAALGGPITHRAGKVLQRRL